MTRSKTTVPLDEAHRRTKLKTGSKTTWLVGHDRWLVARSPAGDGPARLVGHDPRLVTRPSDIQHRTTLGEQDS
jgi:hypothetical protein